MASNWKRPAILMLALSVVGAGSLSAAPTAQEHEHEAARQEGTVEQQHDMGSMMAEMKKMMATMHEHMAMMHAMMGRMHGGEHGDMAGMHGGEHGDMAAMHGGEHGEMAGMRGDGMGEMMRMPDPATIDDPAKATTAADKLAKHLEMMQQMIPKLEARIEALRNRAAELGSEQS